VLTIVPGLGVVVEVVKEVFKAARIRVNVGE
jgi:hypothetical protein